MDLNLRTNNLEVLGMEASCFQHRIVWLPGMDSNHIIDTFWICCSLLISKVAKVVKSIKKQAPGTKSVHWSLQKMLGGTQPLRNSRGPTLCCTERNADRFASLLAHACAVVLPFGTCSLPQQRTRSCSARESNANYQDDTLRACPESSAIQREDDSGPCQRYRTIKDFWVSRQRDNRAFRKLRFNDVADRLQ